MASRNTRLAIGVVVVIAGLAGAADPPRQEAKPNRFMSAAQPVTAEAVAETVSVQPGGTVQVGVLFAIPEGWHIYAAEPGDAGLPTKIEWAGPPESEFGDVVYPPHHEFLDPGNIKTFGYSNEVLLVNTFSAPPGAQPGDRLKLSAEAKWLACKEVCIPGAATLELILPVAAGAPALSTHAPKFTGS